MMLRYSFDMDKEADAVEAAVDAVLKEGWRCGDIMQGGGERMSPKRFSVTMTSNWLGSRTICMAALSTYIWRSSTSG